MNPELARLHAYPFEKLSRLLAGNTPPAHLAPIALSIGEPRHASPAFVQAALTANLDKLSTYPTTKGLLALRQSIAGWLQRRFRLQGIDPETEILPVNGTREALFSFTQAVIDRTHRKTLVLMPDPFYQIYEGAVMLAGGEPWYLPCTAGNAFIPDYDATVVTRLAAAGAVIIGKNHLHELAYGVTNENPHFGPCRNPWDPRRVPGGSSGGSAAAVAAGLSFASYGTDTGGSIRIPASYCGVTGLKPTYGRISRHGVFPLSTNLDHVGPFNFYDKTADLISAWMGAMA